MNTSSRFAVAVHVLSLLATTSGPVSSVLIGGSVNTNPVLIRRILGQLGRAGLTQSVRGAAGGTLLARAPAQINLLDVYRAVEEPGVLALHRSDPNPACEVGRNITRVLGGVFDRAQDAVERVIESMTLQDILRQLKVKQATS
jgi:Rrf2 family protein